MAAVPAVLRFSTFEVTKQVFFKSKLSLGLVNLKPIVDNHVLVVPRRVTPRLADLTPDEVSDLFLSVQLIGKVIEKATNAKSLTIACQDGSFAGQSVPHVHVHILPRRPNDFEPMDAVYDRLEEVDIERDQHDRGDSNGASQGKDKLKMDSERKPRSDAEMEKEATYLASLFPEPQHA